MRRSSTSCSGLSSKLKSVKRSHGPRTKYEGNHPRRRKSSRVRATASKGEEAERDDRTVFCFLGEFKKCVGRPFSTYIEVYNICIYSAEYAHIHIYIYEKYCNIICIQYTCIRDVNLLLYHNECIQCGLRTRTA